MIQKTIHEIVREAERFYIEGSSSRISKYVDFNQYENINRIEAYLNSKHITGDVDDLGREKPFFNIVIAAVNIWYRATKIQKELIKVRADKNEDVLSSFLATVHLHDWMKRENFGQFLSDWGLTLARYGSAVTKFVEKGGKLHCSVIPWNRLITDTVDFDNNLKIEKLYMTPAQLKMNKAYNQEVVDQLLTALQARRKLDKQNIDNIQEYVELYEVHGMMPRSLLTNNEEDDEDYVQQMHVISFVAGKKKGNFDDFTLVSGKERIDPYLIAHLIREDGRTQSIGAVEYLFDSQWMANHTAKQIKDQLDLASKLIFQTADVNYVGKNALSAIENGDILVHEANMPLTQLQNNSHDITSLQSFSNQWQALAQQISATPDALRGDNPDAGTAYRLQALVTTEAHSLFEEMRDNKDLAIEEMMRKHILPFVKKQMDTVEEISATLNSYQIKQIDAMFVPNEAIKRNNEKALDAILNNKLYTKTDQTNDTAAEAQNIQQGLNTLGNKRFIKPSDIDETAWSEEMSDFEWTAEVDTPSSQENLNLVLTTLTNLFQTIANPQMAQILNTPQGKFLFNKILEVSNTVSPLEMSDMDSQQMPSAPAQTTPAPTPSAPAQMTPAASPLSANAPIGGA